MAVLRRDFLPADLQAEIRDAGVGGVISVQARQSIEETEWLLDLAARHEFIRGVVGWAPLTDPRVEGALGPLSARPKLRAVRHILQSEPDENYVLREDFNAGIGVLERFGLSYDILIFERHLPQTIRLVDRHPNQVFVLDHIAKPRIREQALSPWRENLSELARRENVYCKLSGLVTEAHYQNWTEESLQPYIDTVLEAFGPRRVMFGSDWPVCLLAASYAQWLGIVSKAIAGLSAAERARILGETAIEAYKL
jgi:L-fuconolactonase